MILDGTYHVECIYALLGNIGPNIRHANLSFKMPLKDEPPPQSGLVAFLDHNRNLQDLHFGSMLARGGMVQELLCAISAHSQCLEALSLGFRVVTGLSIDFSQSIVAVIESCPRLHTLSIRNLPVEVFCVLQNLSLLRARGNGLALKRLTFAKILNVESQLEHPAGLSQEEWNSVYANLHLEKYGLDRCVISHEHSIALFGAVARGQFRQLSFSRTVLSNPEPRSLVQGSEVLHVFQTLEDLLLCDAKIEELHLTMSEFISQEDRLYAHVKPSNCILRALNIGFSGSEESRALDQLLELNRELARNRQSVASHHACRRLSLLCRESVLQVPLPIPESWTDLTIDETLSILDIFTSKIQNRLQIIQLLCLYDIVLSIPLRGSPTLQTIHLEMYSCQELVLLLFLVSTGWLMASRAMHARVTELLVSAFPALSILTRSRALLNQNTFEALGHWNHVCVIFGYTELMRQAAVYFSPDFLRIPDLVAGHVCMSVDPTDQLVLTDPVTKQTCRVFRALTSPSQLLERLDCTDECEASVSTMQMLIEYFVFGNVQHSLRKETISNALQELAWFILPADAYKSVDRFVAQSLDKLTLHSCLQYGQDELVMLQQHAELHDLQQTILALHRLEEQYQWSVVCLQPKKS